MITRFVKLSLALALVVASSGCRSKLTGNDGNFDFTYAADDDVSNFNKPIAVGARLDVKVQETGTSRDVALTSASTDDEAVLKVAGLSGSQFTLLGAGAGGALVSVTGKTSGGQEKSDSVNMLARVPEVLKLRHSCGAGTDAHYLVGQSFVLHYEMQMLNGQPVIGYGYFPIAISPAGALVLDLNSKDQTAFHLTAAAAAQTVTIASTIDAAQVRLVLVTEGQVDGAVLLNGDSKTFVGNSNLYNVNPTVAGAPICQAQTEVVVSGTSPDICDVALATGAVNDPHGSGVVKVTGKAVGYCTWTLNYPRGRGGLGASASFSTPVAEVVNP